MSDARPVTRTNVFTLLCVVIRAITAWVALTLLAGLPGLFVAMDRMRSEDGSSAAPTFAIAAVGMLIVLALAWVFADKLARVALVSSKSQVFESDVSPSDWLAFALASVGAWHLFTGLVAAVRVIARVLALSPLSDYPQTGDVGLVPDLAALVVQLGLALALLIGAPGIARLVTRLRGRAVPTG